MWRQLSLRYFQSVNAQCRTPVRKEPCIAIAAGDLRVKDALDEMRSGVRRWGIVNKLWIYRKGKYLPGIDGSTVYDFSGQSTVATSIGDALGAYQVD
jgi:hypothetical protein